MSVAIAQVAARFQSGIGLFAAIMLQDKHPDRRGQPLIPLTRRINAGSKGIHRLALLGGDGAKGVPERRLQRDAGAVSVQGQRVFGGARCHRRSLAADPSGAKGARQSVAAEWEPLCSGRGLSDRDVYRRLCRCCHLRPIACNCATALILTV